MAKGLRPGSRAFKIQQAKEVRKVSNQLQSLVYQGIITKSDRKTSLRAIGQRIKFDDILRRIR